MYSEVQGGNCITYYMYTFRCTIIGPDLKGLSDGWMGLQKYFGDMIIHSKP